MSLCQTENGFSLDELVKKFADAFENKAFAEILKMNLQLTQEVLMHRIFNNLNSQQCCPGRAKIGMFGYIRRWLKWGLISPRAFSVIERVIRELGRRLKKTAYGSKSGYFSASIANTSALSSFTKSSSSIASAWDAPPILSYSTTLRLTRQASK